MKLFRMQMRMTVSESFMTGCWKGSIELTRSEKPSGSYSSAMKTMGRECEYGVIRSKMRNGSTVRRGSCEAKLQKSQVWIGIVW